MRSTLGTSWSTLHANARQDARSLPPDEPYRHGRLSAIECDTRGQHVWSGMTEVQRLRAERDRTEATWEHASAGMPEFKAAEHAWEQTRVARAEYDRLFAIWKASSAHMPEEAAYAAADAAWKHARDAQ